MSADQDKQKLRERIWNLLESEHAAPTGVQGTIPSFYGADRTADLLSDRPEWRGSRVIKANPDRAQRPIRVRALEDSKLLYVAVPKMATIEPFYVLDPAANDLLPDDAVEQASKGARTLISIDAMQPIDVVICGSVAVNRSGDRIGKGAGYSDLEVALLTEAGWVTDKTVIVAPVHPLQVVEDEIPTSDHDFQVDLIVTPDEVIECQPSRRSTGLIWKDLDAAKVADIPILASMAASRTSAE
ncbi:5-formyltetrahydrofolate cyclo-ligase [Kribbella sp. GL6]|uniref:5-formyltetrahydrofolate cyclo-ligase n=1 Tax=Kribbella sp. GL6 TaxID=3419765 RepID=UPI003CFEDB1C